jgi:hypothetical protein
MTQYYRISIKSNSDVFNHNTTMIVEKLKHTPSICVDECLVKTYKSYSFDISEEYVTRFAYAFTRNGLPESFKLLESLYIDNHEVVHNDSLFALLIQLEEYPPLDVSPVEYKVIRTYDIPVGVLGLNKDTEFHVFYIGANEADSEDELYDVFNSKTRIKYCDETHIYPKNPQKNRD